MRSSAASFYLLVGYWLLMAAVAAAAADSSRSTASELGTKDGYDVGGTRPICYVTDIQKDPNVPDTDGSNYTAIESLNDAMFGHDNNNDHHNDNTTTTTTASSVSLLSSVRETKPASNEAYF